MRKFPKISPKHSCPRGTPALPLQQGSLSPEGYLYSISWETQLGYHPGGPRATGAGTSPLHRLTRLFEKAFDRGLMARGTAQAQERRGSQQPKRQDNEQETEHMVASHSPEEEHRARPVQVGPKTEHCPVSSMLDPLVRAEPHPGPHSFLLWNQRIHHTQVLTLQREGKHRLSDELKTNYFFIQSLVGI